MTVVELVVGDVPDFLLGDSFGINLGVKDMLDPDCMALELIWCLQGSLVEKAML